MFNFRRTAVAPAAPLTLADEAHAARRLARRMTGRAAAAADVYPAAEVAAREAAAAEARLFAGLLSIAEHTAA